MPMRFPSPNQYATRLHAPEVQHFDERLRAKYYEAVDLLEKDPSVARNVFDNRDSERYFLMPTGRYEFLGLGLLVLPMVDIRELYFFCAKPIFGAVTRNPVKLSSYARREMHNALALYAMRKSAE